LSTTKNNGHPTGWPWLPIGYTGGDARTETESLPAGPTLTAGLPRLGRVDGERPATEVFAIESLNRRLRGTVVCHVDEAKPPRPAGLAVGNEIHLIHRTIGLKELADIIFRGGKRQIANIDIHGMVLYRNRGK
jgi:hypothetical protein